MDYSSLSTKVKDSEFYETEKPDENSEYLDLCSVSLCFSYGGSRPYEVQNAVCDMHG